MGKVIEDGDAGEKKRNPPYESTYWTDGDRGPVSSYSVACSACEKKKVRQNCGRTHEGMTMKGERRGNARCRGWLMLEIMCDY